MTTFTKDELIAIQFMLNQANKENVERLSQRTTEAPLEVIDSAYAKIIRLLVEIKNDTNN